MSKSLDIRLLDTVAEDVKKKRIARVGACRIEDLRWINDRLCVENEPIVAMPVLLTDDKTHTSIVHREVLFALPHDEYRLVTATGSRENACFDILLRPFFSRKEYAGYRADKIRETHGLHGLARCMGTVKYIERFAYCAVPLEERIKEEVLSVTRENGSDLGGVCFLPSFHQACKALIRRLYDDVDISLKWEIGRSEHVGCKAPNVPPVRAVPGGLMAGDEKITLTERVLETPGWIMEKQCVFAFGTSSKGGHVFVYLSNTKLCEGPAWEKNTGVVIRDPDAAPEAELLDMIAEQFEFLRTDDKKEAESMYRLFVGRAAEKIRSAAGRACGEGLSRYI